MLIVSTSRHRYDGSYVYDRTPFDGQLEQLDVISRVLEALDAGLTHRQVQELLSA